MNKFKIGDRVIAIVDNEVKRGTIKRTYSDIGVFVVEFDDGNVGKVSESFIAHEPKTETKAETTVESEVEEKHEDAPRMRSEITITPDEFKKIACRIIAEETVNHIMVGVVFMPILAKICKALFSDKESENSDNVE